MTAVTSCSRCDVIVPGVFRWALVNCEIYGERDFSDALEDETVRGSR